MSGLVNIPFFSPVFHASPESGLTNANSFRDILRAVRLLRKRQTDHTDLPLRVHFVILRCVGSPPA